MPLNKSIFFAKKEKIMPHTLAISPVAHIYNDMTQKFGIPRQSGLAKGVLSKIVFCPEFASADAVRGLEGFSHIWLLWEFSESKKENVSLTVRPPRLGGNERLGVFATRSPFRPNPIGLSCVRLDRIVLENDKPVLYVLGADLMNGTPILDIKPYLPYADCIPDAAGGFAEGIPDTLRVDLCALKGDELSREELDTVVSLLECDPRPRYHNDPSRVYGMAFGSKNVKFRVENGTLYLLKIE